MKKLLVTPEEYFKNHPLKDVTPTMWFNAIELLVKINTLREELGIPFVVTSGYRPLAHNKTIGGSTNSNHIQCAAIDIRDADGRIFAAMTANNNALLEKYDLYAECRSATPNWCHLATKPPRSKLRVFKP
jgi:hypothetical protein